MVLDGIGDNVLLPCGGPKPGSLCNGPVIGLGTAAGKIDLLRLGSQAFRHCSAGGHQRQIGLPPLLVEAAGIAIQLMHGRQHGVDSGLAHGSGSRVVSVYKHRSDSFFPEAGPSPTEYIFL